MMKKILMVCLGNICRSPMAEGILKHHLNKAGIDAYVDSAGTSAWHEGERPDSRAINECRKFGVNISSQRSRPFVSDDLETFDLIFAMDQENYNNILRHASSEDQKAKVHLIMNLVFPGKNIAVPDPYYGGDDGFTNVYIMLEKAAEKIVEGILNE